MSSNAFHVGAFSAKRRDLSIGSGYLRTSPYIRSSFSGKAYFSFGGRVDPICTRAGTRGSRFRARSTKTEEA